MADLTGRVPSTHPREETSLEVGGEKGQYYGVPDGLTKGLTQVKGSLSHSHPLEFSEKNFMKNEENRQMAILRNVQGLHAPMKLQMERLITSKVQRLPGLQSSMVALDTLLDENVGVEDYLSDYEFSELTVDTHSVMEAQCGGFR